MDDRCGYSVDIVDNFVHSRVNAAFFAHQFVDKPVETVDESSFGCVYPVFAIVHTVFIRRMQGRQGRSPALHSLVYNRERSMNCCPRA